MALLDMQGPFDLTTAGVNSAVARNIAGNYGLGYVDTDNAFIVNYVGRSDIDVGGRLHNWVGSYRKFKFSYASSAKAAFEKECRNYHDFGGGSSLDNDAHPDRPNGTNWMCPVCSIFR